MDVSELDAALAALGWKVSDFCRATGLHRNTPSMWRNQGAAIPAWVPQHLGLLLDVKRLHAAHAVPSFARQTGAECAACHVGGYGPQLTPYGIRFKLGGYTDSDGKGGKVPLSAMLIGSVTHTSKAQADEIIVLDSLKLAAPKTKEMVKVLRALGATKKALCSSPKRMRTCSVRPTTSPA